MYFHEERLVGYCLLNFTELDVHRRKVVCIGASTAFLPAYRHCGSTASFSVSEADKYWLVVVEKWTLPFTLKKLVDMDIKNESHFIFHVGRRANYSDSELDAFQSANILEIEYYCQLNSNIHKGNALMVDILANMKQLIWMGVKWIRR